MIIDYDKLIYPQLRMPKRDFFVWLIKRFDFENPIDDAHEGVLYFSVNYDDMNDEDRAIAASNDCGFNDDGQLYLIVNYGDSNVW